MIKSLHWRLQIWHGLVLVGVIGLFGGYVYSLQWEARVRQVDGELYRGAEVVMFRLRRTFPGPPPPPPHTEHNEPRPLHFAARLPEPPDAIGPRRPPNERAPDAMGPPPPPPPPPEEGRERDGRDRDGRKGRGWPGPPPSATDEDFLNPPDRPAIAALYYVIWNRDGVTLAKSKSAPEIPLPQVEIDSKSFIVREARTRGLKREVILASRFGINVIVGRSMELDMAEQHATALLTAMAGAAIVAVGIVGGGYLTSRSLRPISAMSATAAAISADNLHQRISTTDTDSELGQLASVLNETFDRLRDAFERQTQFTADASHELRTPLAVILAQTQVALAKPRSVEDYRAALESCSRAGKRMKGLIDQLLALARFDAAATSLTPEPLSLHTLVQETADFLVPLADEKQITIRTHLDHATVLGNWELMALCVTNLLSNAIRYNHAAGQVDVHLHARNDRVELLVEDTGVGIPEESLPFVFERFYRVDKVRSRQDGGSGLGLSICKAVVDAHGGEISIANRPTGGAIVRLILPRLGGPIPGIADNAAPSEQLAT